MIKRLINKEQRRRIKDLKKLNKLINLLIKKGLITKEDLEEV